MTDKIMHPKKGPNIAFGLFDETMIPRLRHILHSFGLRMIVHGVPSQWGDQVEVTIEPIKEKGK